MFRHNFAYMVNLFRALLDIVMINILQEIIKILFGKS